MGAPELHRSGHTPVDPGHAEEVAEHRRFDARDPGPQGVPPANQPGHHPEVEQDKPSPSVLRAASAKAVAQQHQRFELAFDPRLRPVVRALGVHADRAGVELDGERLTVRFGPWTVATTVGNVASATITGPYRWWKVIGPPRLSLADRGLTFATNAERGVCLQFHQSVPGSLPTSLVRHPALTVTPADPEGLVAAIERAADLLGSDR